jgi:2-deoxy-D-gluconate 3-dehydrogenase
VKTACIPASNSAHLIMASQFLTGLFSLEGKTAIVTGGTGGLGKAMTVGLAKAGATIVSIELPNDPLSTKLAEEVAAVGSTVKAFTCDLANPKDLRRCYASIWENGITPDILLNCAGVMRRDKCEDAKDEDIDLVSFLPRSILRLRLSLSYTELTSSR